MPFDDFKTLPQGFSITQIMQPVAWAVEFDEGIQEELFLRVGDAQYYAKVSSELSGKEGFEGRVVPLYRSPPAAVEPRVPLFRSEFAALEAVAIAEEQRHDEPTCCGERQVTDVGEGWRLLGPDEVLCEGDEGEFGTHDEPWEPTQCVGRRVGVMADRYRRRVTPAADAAAQWRDLRKGEEIMDGDEAYYALIGWKPSHLKVGTVVGDGPMQFRRRVTPELAPIASDEPVSARCDTVPPAPELSPAAVSAMCQRNERDALLKKIGTLRSEGDQQQEIILHAGLEIERLRSEVERLRLLPEERAAIKRMIGEPNSHPSWAESRFAKLLRDMLNRQGGGE